MRSSCMQDMLLEGCNNLLHASLLCSFLLAKSPFCCAQCCLSDLFLHCSWSSATMELQDKQQYCHKTFHLSSQRDEHLFSILCGSQLVVFCESKHESPHLLLGMLCHSCSMLHSL